MKALFQNKKAKIGVLAVLLLIIVLGGAVAAHGSYSRQQIQKHIATAEKYLLELDYEQAIVEYTLALSMDPKNQETQTALEKVYLDYAQSYIDKEKYDKALEILYRGYDQLQTETLQEKTDEIERRKAEKEEAERVQKEQEEARKEQEEAQKRQEEAQKQAEREKERKRMEELSGIYKWEISNMDIITDFPVVIDDPYDSDTSYGFYVQFGMSEDMKLIEKYTIHIGKEDGKAEVNGLEQTYDLAITDEMKEEYAVYSENQKVFDGYAQTIADYVIDTYFDANGYKVVLYYHPEYSRVTDCKKDSDVFEGKIVLSRDYYDPLYVTCRVDLSNQEAEIIDIDTRYSTLYDDESFLRSLIDSKIQL